MERANRASVSTFYAPGAWGARVELSDSAAHHANVKRLSVGDAVGLVSGDGRRAAGSIVELSKRSLIVAVESMEEVDRPPFVELLAPVGDRDRMLMLAEKSVELGLSSWRPVMYERSKSVSPRGDGTLFREKLRARQISALEQSSGAWLPELHVETALEPAINAAAGSTRLVLDQSGVPFAGLSNATTVSIALGPEGGLSDAEREQFASAGWQAVSLNTNVLRFETAGIAALAIVRSHLR